VNKCEEIENPKVPILILGNKFNDKEEIDSDYINKMFNLDELKECGMKIKYFPMNVLKDNDMIMKALRWLVRHMI
jgi:hypothetical protein